MAKPSAVVLALVALVALTGSARGQEPAAGREASPSEDGTPEPERSPDPPERRPAERSHTLGEDLRRLVSPESALVLGVGGALVFVAASQDHELSRRLAASAVGDRIFEAGDVLGTWLQAGGSVATYAVGKVAGKPALAHLGVDLVRAQALNGVLTFALKVAVQRTRPDGGRHSFPSGHASASFASATVLGRRLGVKAGLPAFLLATYVAVSRVQEKKHFPSDVVFGAALGVTVGRAVTAAHARRGVSLEPIVGLDGGLGLAVRVAWGPGRK